MNFVRFAVLYLGPIIPDRPDFIWKTVLEGWSKSAVLIHQSNLEVKFTKGRPTANVTLEMRRSWNVARRVDVGRHVWIWVILH